MCQIYLCSAAIITKCNKLQNGFYTLTFIYTLHKIYSFQCTLFLCSLTDSINQIQYCMLEMQHCFTNYLLAIKIT